MRRFAIAVLVTLALSHPSALLAQQASSGMQGRVVDESGLALPGVTIVVTHEQSGMFRQVVSNADGTYYLTGVLPGPYKIMAELGGFAKFERLDPAVCRQRGGCRYHVEGRRARGIADRHRPVAAGRHADQPGRRQHLAGRTGRAADLKSQLDDGRGSHARRAGSASRPRPSRATR